MKKLKAISTAATLGLAVLSFATARADDFVWHGTDGDYLWSNTNNWKQIGDPDYKPAIRLPGTSDMLYFQNADDDLTIDNTSTLTGDATVDAFVGFADYITIAGCGHKLTVNRSAGSGERFCKDLIFSGTDSVLECKGTKTAYYFYEPKENGVWAKDGAAISFSKVSFNNKLKFKATAGGKITLPSAAMASSMTFTADGKDSVVSFANTTTSSSSVKANVKILASNGGKVSLSSLLPYTNAGVSFDLPGGVLAVAGEVNLGNNNVAVTMNLSGVKPTGGFLQVSGSKGMSLGGYLTINMKPEYGWADGSSTGLIAYKGTSSATMWDDVHYVVDLSNFYGIEAGVTKTICVFSNTSSGKSYQPSDDTVSFANDTGVDAHFEVVDKAINLVIKRGHYWSDWTISKLPTRSANGQKCRRCTDDGCTAVQTKEIANSKLPGDFLQMDGKGYFETGYTPDVMKSHVELRVQLLSNQEVVNHSLFWPKSGGEWGLVWYEDDKGIQYYDEAEEFSLANPFSDVKKAHVFRAFGNTAQLDNNAVVVGTKEAAFVNCGHLLIGAHKPWNSTKLNWFSKMKVYYFKVWEDDEAKPVHYYVPALNGNQATLFDLVSESYLTPTTGTGFTIGKDPSGLMMFLR